ncbi:MAG: hypothetical protein V8R49_02530 [Duodenibacillus massiliensis]
MVLPPGEARSDIWMMMELAKRFKISECWKKQKAGKKTLPNVLEGAKAMGYSPDATLYDVLYAGMKTVKNCPWPDPKYPNERNCTA